MNIEMEITREVNGEDVTFIVGIELEYHRAYRGARDSLCGVLGAGPALEPDEQAELEIESVINTENGHDIELTDSEIETAIEKGWEQLENERDY